MNEKITIPENTRVIIEDDVIIFERKEKPVLKVGEWYDYGFGYKILWLGNNKGYCLAPDGFCSGITDTTSIKPNELSLSDMSKVKELLIKEAEKIGFKEGVKFKLDNFNHTFTFKGKPCFHPGQGCFIYGSDYNGYIFNPKTGKWAEIIEEKKPLYVNSFGTEFFEGNDCWFIVKDNSILEHMIVSDYKSLKDGRLTSEIMTKKECYQYLADNCKE